MSDIDEFNKLFVELMSTVPKGREADALPQIKRVLDVGRKRGLVNGDTMRAYNAYALPHDPELQKRANMAAADPGRKFGSGDLSVPDGGMYDNTIRGIAARNAEMMNDPRSAGANFLGDLMNPLVAALAARTSPKAAASVVKAADPSNPSYALTAQGAFAPTIKTFAGLRVGQGTGKVGGLAARAAAVRLAPTSPVVQNAATVAGTLAGGLIPMAPGVSKLIDSGVDSGVGWLLGDEAATAIKNAGAERAQTDPWYSLVTDTLLPLAATTRLDFRNVKDMVDAVKKFGSVGAKQFINEAFGGAAVTNEVKRLANAQRLVDEANRALMSAKGDAKATQAARKVAKIASEELAAARSTVGKNLRGGGSDRYVRGTIPSPAEIGAQRAEDSARQINALMGAAPGVAVGAATAPEGTGIIGKIIGGATGLLGTPRRIPGVLGNMDARFMGIPTPEPGSALADSARSAVRTGWDALHESNGFRVDGSEIDYNTPGPAESLRRFIAENDPVTAWRRNQDPGIPLPSPMVNERRANSFRNAVGGMVDEHAADTRGEIMGAHNAEVAAENARAMARQAAESIDSGTVGGRGHSTSESARVDYAASRIAGEVGRLLSGRRASERARRTAALYNNRTGGGLDIPAPVDLPAADRPEIPALPEFSPERDLSALMNNPRPGAEPDAPIGPPKPEWDMSGVKNPVKKRPYQERGWLIGDSEPIEPRGIITPDTPKPGSGKPLILPDSAVRKSDSGIPMPTPEASTDRERAASVARLIPKPADITPPKAPDKPAVTAGESVAENGVVRRTHGMTEVVAEVTPDEASVQETERAMHAAIMRGDYTRGEIVKVGKAFTQTADGATARSVAEGLIRDGVGTMEFNNATGGFKYSAEILGTTTGSGRKKISTPNYQLTIEHDGNSATNASIKVINNGQDRATVLGSDLGVIGPKGLKGTDAPSPSDVSEARRQHGEKVDDPVPTTPEPPKKKALIPAALDKASPNTKGRNALGNDGKNLDAQAGHDSAVSSFGVNANNMRIRMKDTVLGMEVTGAKRITGVESDGKRVYSIDVPFAENTGSAKSPAYDNGVSYVRSAKVESGAELYSVNLYDAGRRSEITINGVYFDKNGVLRLAANGDRIPFESHIDPVVEPSKAINKVHEAIKRSKGCAE